MSKHPQLPLWSHPPPGSAITKLQLPLSAASHAETMLPCALAAPQSAGRLLFSKQFSLA
jgi:hypothetical protein